MGGMARCASILRLLSRNQKNNTTTRHYSTHKPPRQPEEYECCGNGCDACVWDTYFKQQADYLKWKRANPAPKKKALKEKPPTPTA